HFPAERLQAAGQGQHQVLAFAHDAPDAILGSIRIEGKCIGWPKQRRFVNLHVAEGVAAPDEHLECLGPAFRGQMVRSEESLHIAERFLRRGDQAYADRPLGFGTHFRRVQIHDRLSNLPEDCESHGCEWAEGARNITRNSCLHCIPIPTRSIGTLAEKYWSTFSLDGWKSSAGATSSSRGGPVRKGIPGK